jgi:transcriptional regulator with XRE-family HTH domain
MFTLYADEDMEISFGRYIKQQRLRLEYSLRKVCEAVLNDEGNPISVSYLNDIEQERRNPPTGKVVVQLAKVLELNAQDLLGRAGKVDPIIEETVNKEAGAGVLFRRIAEQAKADPTVLEWIKKALDKKDVDAA